MTPLRQMVVALLLSIMLIGIGALIGTHERHQLEARVEALEGACGLPEVAP